MRYQHCNVPMAKLGVREDAPDEGLSERSLCGCIMSYDAV